MSAYGMKPGVNETSWASITNSIGESGLTHKVVRARKAEACAVRRLLPLSAKIQ